MTDSGSPVRRDIVGLFNWDHEKPADISLDPGSLDLPESKTGKYVAYDYWQDSFIPEFSGSTDIELAPGSCKIIAIKPLEAYPQVLSTSRHVTQGIVDIVNEKWTPEKKSLSGTSRLVGGDSYVIAIHPGKKEYRQIAVSCSSYNVTAGTLQTDPIIKIELKADKNCMADWNIRFK